MGWLDLIRRKAARQPNIAVYYLIAVVDGIAKASPLGVVPRFSDDFEKAMREKRRPGDGPYLNGSMGENAVIFCWEGNAIVAISFLSAAEAQQTFPGLVRFASEDLAALDGVLTHFPR